MRIVSLVPSATETLYELGLEDQIVAITRYCVKPADRVRLKPKVGGTKNPIVSEIIALKPDIVIVDVEENREEDAEALQAAGIQLYVTFPKTMRESADMIRDMGKTFGAESRANEIADMIFKQMLKCQRADLCSALIFIWKQPYMTINHDTYVHDVCRFFGFENVFAEATERYPKLSDQQIREVFPSIALFPDDPYPFRPREVQEFQAQFPHIPRTLLFDGQLITWHGYGTLRALTELPPVLARI